MKKILLSCVTCLLALGLVTACEDEVEEVPNEPESTEPSGNTGDGSGNGGSQNDDGAGNEETIYKLGFLDADNYCYRFFNGASYTTTSSGNTNGPFLSTTTEWDEAVEVVIEAVEVVDETETGEEDDEIVGSPCLICFVDSEGSTQYLSHESTYSNTGITFSDEAYTWYWVEGETYSYFATGDGSRYICAYNDSIRAYATSNLGSNVPVSVFTVEPEPVENPNAGLTAVTAETLTSGSQYYVGAVADAELGTYYLFDGGNYSNQQLTGTQVLEDAVLVTATSVETSGWKFTFTLEVDGVDTEYTLYSYMSGNYCEISAAPTASITESSYVTTFGWDSTYHGITVTFDSAEYFLAQNRNSSYAYEFQMAAYSSYASTDTWASFYSSVTKIA